MEVIVFTIMGITYHFKNVSEFTPTTNGFKFKYTGIATGVTRTIEFNNLSTVGYSINEMENK